MSTPTYNICMVIIGLLGMIANFAVVFVALYLQSDLRVARKARSRANKILIECFRNHEIQKKLAFDYKVDPLDQNNLIDSFHLLNREGWIESSIFTTAIEMGIPRVIMSIRFSEKFKKKLNEIMDKCVSERVRISIPRIGNVEPYMKKYKERILKKINYRKFE